MSWARDLMSWARDLMSWERDKYFFFTFPLSAAVDTPSVWIHLKFRILSRLTWVHSFWKNNLQKTHACNKNPLTQPHCMGSSVNLCLLVIHNVCRTFIIYKK